MALYDALKIMAKTPIDMSHYYRVQKVRLNNISRMINRTTVEILKIIREHNAKVAELKNKKP